MELSRDLSHSLVESTTRIASGYRPGTDLTRLVPGTRERAYNQRGQKPADPRPD